MFKFGEKFLWNIDKHKLTNLQQAGSQDHTLNTLTNTNTHVFFIFLSLPCVAAVARGTENMWAMQSEKHLALCDAAGRGV